MDLSGMGVTLECTWSGMRMGIEWHYTTKIDNFKGDMPVNMYFVTCSLLNCPFPGDNGRIGESPSICPFLKNNGDEAPKGRVPLFFRNIQIRELSPTLNTQINCILIDIV